MNRNSLIAGLLAAATLMSGCANPETPQEVSRLFWQSVIENDASEADDYSTLVNEAAFDGFERDWRGVTVQWGRVVIDGNEARIETVLEGMARQTTPLETTTYLVRKGDEWLVDYYRTGDALAQGPLFEQVIGKLEQLGQDLQARWSTQSSELADDIERMTRDLEKQATLANERFTLLLEDYAGKLEQQLEALSRSIEEALEQHPSSTPEDRRRLNQAVIRLDDQSQRLQEPDLQSVAMTTQVAAETRLTLAQLGDEFAGYKAEWNQRVSDMESELAALFRQFTGAES
ncbi:hypothetical protein [Marinobacter sp. CA1]|uniref:hypothetical protein n=1 Tax=Marinobacter sp. CA1 TaxID=2817656 RepID=UPI001D05E750|nr:hypothetical protein [Marinobacter sp. CA1]UDL06211.1 hypothetical protein J2887_05485 [Marinobacter sp. CA1]